MVLLSLFSLNFPYVDKKKLKEFCDEIIFDEAEKKEKKKEVSDIEIVGEQFELMNRDFIQFLHEILLHLDRHFQTTTVKNREDEVYCACLLWGEWNG